ncbi:MAG: hypothetical protein Q4G62_03150 [Pseudomonadota bacterium]|nr:hypothetical protein [Pseudomonadota bacterium]
MKTFAMLPILPILLSIAACGSEQVPEQPPKQPTELREAMQAPLDKARDVEAVQKQAEEERRRQLDAAEL